MSKEVKTEAVERSFRRIGKSRKFKIINGQNSWEIEICDESAIDLYFLLDGFSCYKIYLDGRVEGSFGNKTSTRISGDFKYTLLDDEKKWKTIRLKALIKDVKEYLVNNYRWKV